MLLLFDGMCYDHPLNIKIFGEVLVITAGYKFKMNIEVKSEVSPDTTYAAYFVYKLPKEQFKFEAPLYMWDQHVSFKPDSYIYLVSPPHTPFIGPYSDENTHNPLNRYKGNGIPQQRTDGWMEVKVWELQTTTETVSMRFHFEHSDRKNLKGLMVEGIELRPI
nr:protein kinase-like domain, phloem protein 2-like protein [Tanacetum cinerariifolium]